MNIKDYIELFTKEIEKLEKLISDTKKVKEKYPDDKALDIVIEQHQGRLKMMELERRIAKHIQQNSIGIFMDYQLIDECENEFEEKELMNILQRMEDAGFIKIEKDNVTNRWKVIRQSEHNEKQSQGTENIWITGQKGSGMSFLCNYIKSNYKAEIQKENLNKEVKNE